MGYFRRFPVLLAGVAAFLAGCTDSPTDPANSTPVDVFVHAHLDDWQLFMGDRVHQSVQAGHRVVLVYTTAGDAGSHAQYWQTRQRAAQASVDQMTGSEPLTCATQVIQGHDIQRCSKGNVVSYYMGLPDGNWEDGTGYGFGSMGLLRDRNTPTRTRDQTATYATWSDFYTTLAAIVEHEAQGRTPEQVTVHAPDHDRSINPADHPDHWATGDAARAAANGKGWNLAWYVDYNTEWMDRNLSAEARAVKHRLFKAYDDVMAAAGFERLIDRPNFQAWLWRTYFRTETATAR